MRTGLFAAAGVVLFGLGACAPEVPDSGAGVGFTDYEGYRQTREAELQGQRAAALPPAQAVSSEPLSATAPQGNPATATATNTTSTSTVTTAMPPASATGSTAPSDIAAETQAALNASAVNSGQEPLQASPSNPAPEAVGAFGISRENDFSAVGEQRSIDADAARIAQNRAQYQQVQPTALPSRTNTGPNIVQYALSTSHAPGQQQYTRSGFGASRYERNCRKYPSPDLAQTDFLSNGGPQRDKLGLDPDGDGYACSWDPRPFRTARGG